MKTVSLGQFLEKGNNNLDLIRIACAFFVIYSHSFPISPFGDSNDILYKITLQGYISFGGVAVKTFFLISGMLVTNSLLSNGKPLTYVSSRFFRVYPAFVTTILITALIIAPVISNLPLRNYYSSTETWRYILNNLRMNIHYTLPGVFTENKLNAVNGSIWTIPFEIKAYFYLLLIYLFSLLTGSYRKHFIAMISLAIIIEPLTPFKGVMIAKSADPSVYLLYPFFAAGCLLSILKNKINNYGLLFLSILSLIAYLASHAEIYKLASFYAFSSLLLVFLASTAMIQKLKIKNDISYGVYLWAFPVQQIIASTSISSPYMNVFIAILISSAAGYISFIYIEKPCMKLNKRIMQNNYRQISSNLKPRM